MPALPSLPPEIYLAIKDAIPQSDLRSHVCFYKTSRSIAKLYDDVENADDFWAEACWRCGLGRSARLPVPPDPRPSWRDFAIDMIERDGFCDHPQCGESRLEENRALVESLVDPGQGRDPLRVGDNPEDFPELLSHPLFCQVGFLSTPGHPVEEDAHIVPTESEEVESTCREVGIAAQGISISKKQSKDNMHAHPFIANSFATFPPISHLVLRCFHGHRPARRLYINCKNRDAITLLTVLTALHPNLEEPLEHDTVLEYLREYMDDDAHVPDNWEAIQRMQTIRELVTIW
ncbi:hypothetical protein C8Q77DRAFT_1135891 [Trametes polyzona]|nr:hypothetical protein C8Q77DRAFT_1135891 [Trametes polyzona]